MGVYLNRSRLFLFAIFTLTVTTAPASSLRLGGTAGAAGLPQKFPLAFEECTDGAAISYIAQGAGYRIALRDDGARIRLAGSTVSMRFAGGRRAVGRPEGEVAGRINHILGNDPRMWRVGLPAYRRIAYHGVYPGVDVVYYGNQGQLEFDLLLQPGADPAQIRLEIDGASGVNIRADGALSAHTSAGDLRLPPPAIYQNAAGGRHNLAGRYVLLGMGEVGFSLDDFDATEALVIDPTVVYAALLGGGVSTTAGFAVAVDSNGNGNGYYAGVTFSSDFPTADAAFPDQEGGQDAFITKVDPTGTTLLYSTFIGGQGVDSVHGIAVDSGGNLWAAGFTSSLNFPTMGALQSAFTGSYNCVIFKLDAGGNLAFSTLFGTGYVEGRAIAVDGMGNAYVTGYLKAGSTIPATGNAYLTSPPGGVDAFAARFNQNGTLVYASYLGGTGDDYGWGIAADSSGSAYVTGSSTSSGFPSAPGGGVQTVNRGDTDAFVAKFNAAGSALSYFTFLGGGQIDIAHGIAVDGAGSAYVAGETYSSDFPTTAGVLQAAYQGGAEDGFVTKLSPDGSKLTYSTFLGSNRTDSIVGLAIDSNLNVYVTGETSSDHFPVLQAIEPTPPANITFTSLFRSTDAGSAWAPFDQNVGGAVYAILPDPSAEGTIVALTDGGVYRTTNAGATWARTFVPDSSVAGNGGGSISRSLADGSTIYLLYFANGNSGVNTVVYRSVDGGATWGSPATLLAGNALYSAIIQADPAAPSTVYAAATTDTLYKSTDGGMTWNTIATGLASAPVLTFLGSPDGSLYFDTYIAVYKSTNQGAAWNSISTGLAGNGVPNGLAVSPGNPAILYRGEGGATISKTTNGGATWSPITISFPGYATTMAVSPANSSVVFATSGSAPSLYVSLDGGATWNAAVNGLGGAAPQPASIVFDPVDTATVYLVTPLGDPAGFVTQINSSGSALVYSTYFAGSGDTEPSGIAVSSGGDALVVGTSSNLPVTTTKWQGGYIYFDIDQAFIARISAATAACTYTITPLSKTIYGGAYLSFEVLAPSGCAWTASSDQSFATIETPASGAGSAVVLVLVAANTTGQTRTVHIAIGGQTATVTQADSSCTYGLNPSYVSVAAAGGEVDVALTTGAGCAWTVTDSDPNALTVLSASSGTGSTTVRLSVAATTTPVQRAFYVAIGPDRFDIAQDGSCAYTISPNAAYFGPAGGTGSVSVTAPANCSWGTDGTSGITFSNSGQMFGNGTVTYTVAPAVSGYYICTVAGTTFTVTQTTPPSYWTEQIAGGQLPPSAVNGTAASIGYPEGMAIDASGNVYFSSVVLNAVFRLDLSGLLTLVAGNGTAGFSGDGGPAVNSQVNNPQGLAVDASGNLYIADFGNAAIRKVDGTGTITTIAGGGTSTADGIPATSAQLTTPYSVAFDRTGDLYLIDGCRIRMVSTTGIIGTVAGNGTCGYAGDNGLAIGAEFKNPQTLLIDSIGFFYVADTGNARVREFSPGGYISTIAGTGVSGFTGDGGPAISAELYSVAGLAEDASYNLYVGNDTRIRKIDTSGKISTVVGNGKFGYSGDGGPATSTQINAQGGMVVDPAGELLFADTGTQRVRKLASGIVTTIAGGSDGDGGAAPFAGLNYPLGLALDSNGNLYIAEDVGARIREITPAGAISTVAGTGVTAFSADNILATTAGIANPNAVAVDVAGSLYIAEAGYLRVRKVSTAGIITTVAGGGTATGDNVPATSAALGDPSGLAVDAHGNLYIADAVSNRIRKVSNGTITTVAGTGTAGYTGDGGPATSAKLNSPSALAFDGSGNLYIADTQNSVIRKVSVGGQITTFAGGGQSIPNGTLATNAYLNIPQGVAADAAGNIYIADTGNRLILMVTTGGTISTIAGGAYFYPQGTAPTLNADFTYPTGIVVDNQGDVYVADPMLNMVFMVRPGLLSVTSSHDGSFTPGASGQYTLNVANVPIGGVTGGTITVTEIPPFALTVSSMSGAGWTCGQASCTRSDAAPNGAYPPIAVAVNVEAPAPVQVTNQVTVSNGNGVTIGAEDLTVIGGVVPATPVLVSPPNLGSSVELGASLVWNAASGAASYSVFFGTSYPPPYLANTTSTSYRTMLSATTTYYWQVVANTPAHTASSAVWSFTTDDLSTCSYQAQASYTPSFPSGGGSDTVNVFSTNGCPWSATSSQSWLTFSPSSGYGDETIAFTVAANTGAARTATITIGGQTIQVSQAGAYLISTIAGGMLPPTAAAGTAAAIGNPQSAAADAAGNVYFTVANMHAVFRFDTAGTLTTVAGNGSAGYSGDNGPALNAQLNGPYGVAVDGSGNLYIADANNSCIRKVNASGTITTVAGNGTPGYSGDTGPAIYAALNNPSGVAADKFGNLYIADTNNYRIREVSGGNVATVAGNGTAGYAGDSGKAIAAEIGAVYSIAVDHSVDQSGSLYIADQANNRVRKVSNTLIATVAGNGTGGYAGDNNPATAAELNQPAAVAVDGSGDLYIADRGNQRVRMVGLNGVIQTVAGNGTAGFAGDGATATATELNSPGGVAVDGLGNLYIADSSNQRIRKVSAGKISTIAGGGTGDGGWAPFAGLNQPAAVAKDANGNVYVAESSGQRVRKIAPSGAITTFAGTGATGFGGDSGPATAALLNSPKGLTVDGTGNVYIADSGNSRVRKVDTNGNITTFAGTGAVGFGGDGGAATAAVLANPSGLAVDSHGNLYIADYGNCVVREVTVAGTITTVAGKPNDCGFGGDGLAATSALLRNPTGVGVDISGNLYIADPSNARVRRVHNHLIATFAGNGTSGNSGDEGLATSAQLSFPQSVAANITDLSFTVYIGDSSANNVRVVSQSGTISTFAGGGSGPPGDGGPAAMATLLSPQGLALDSAGNVYIGEAQRNAVRLATPAGGPPVLMVSGTPAGNFKLGSSGQYMLTVSDAASAGSSSGTVTVNDIVPSPLTVTSMSGTGWNCGTNSCSRMDSLAPGNSYPPITVTASISSSAPAQITNQATVGGGGAAMTGVESLTLITAFSPCDVTQDSLTNVADVQHMINEAAGSMIALNDLNRDGTVDITDIQIVINAALGYGCSAQ